MRMNGWLIVNGFLKSGKFDDVYSLLADSFRLHDVELAVFPNTAFTSPIGTPLTPLKPLKPLKPDFVLFWDKDVALARRLEDAGLPVFNTSGAIACCDSKIETALAFARHGVPAPRTIVAPKTFEGVGFTTHGFLAEAADTLGFPFVVKEAFGSFGRQVYLAKTLAEAEDIVRRIGHKDFLMQEFIEASRGQDLRVNVVGGREIASMRRFSATDFRSNVTLGGGTEPMAPTGPQREAAIAACKAVGADFAGVDILFGQNGEPLVCEVNSNPHFRSALDCTGVNLADSIASFVMEEISGRKPYGRNRPADR